MKETFGVKLKKARQEKELTLQAVADIVGCSASYLHRIENSERTGVNYQIYQKLTEVLDVPDNEEPLTGEQASELERLLAESHEAKMKLQFAIESAFNNINNAMNDLNKLHTQIENRITEVTG